MRAAFSKAGLRKAFRAQFKLGDSLAVQYLIVDKRPENALKNSELPLLEISAPDGSKVRITFKERTKFFEPFGRTNYLYLSRYNAVAQTGVYNFLITSRSKAAITIAVGEKEIFGEVVRGAVPTPSPTPTPTPTPTPSPASFTMDQVRANNSATSCWVAIDGSAYNLTNWIASHPGGPGPILGLCGTDGSTAFRSQHSNSTNPNQRLESFRLGAIKP